ncbi:DNA replication terminus site-binding protein, partial [Vibrio parahaemolyticus]|uniref:DNA replication terminus site-binding protein n=1 Tax=Vibrio parahaemolyticus TaxID=670 RepID=UPI00146EA139
ELSDSINASDLIGAEVYKLPTVPKAKEHVDVTEIPVESIKDEFALYEGLRSYKKLYGEEGISTKVVFRLPGYIQVGSSNSNIKEIIGRINKHKDLFTSAVLKIDGPKKKHDIVHSLFPGLITKQL